MSKDPNFRTIDKPPGEAPALLQSPFAVTPHPWAIHAATLLQVELHQIKHPFGFHQEPDAIGKMFGVLVVENTHAEIGFLAAFSGKLDGQNDHFGFVPPVFDVLDEQGFYRRGEHELNAINRALEQLVHDPLYVSLCAKSTQITAEFEAALQSEKLRSKAAKQQRDAERIHASQEQLEQLIEASKRDHFILRDLKKHWNSQLQTIQDQLEPLQMRIDALRQNRKTKSARLQDEIFSHYTFLNQAGTNKSLGAIFQDFSNSIPPAGAGECTAPKLFQYAFMHGYKPIAIAEFWWGISPQTEVRKHGQFYPACRGKCAPILSHMLSATTTQQESQPQNTLQASILYEDTQILVVSKPAGLLSVPGKEENHSVQTQMRKYVPDATGPMMVHRLDQATSGILVIAKTEAAHKQLQSQFIKRKVEKRYVAILSGNVAHENGSIDLPLRVDLDDRPRQMVCDAFGKSARTHYQIIERWPNGCRVHFYPITGRTHQLRVHAAHNLGLNAPIKGDDLYGTPADRLYLHAEYLKFEHPESGKWMEFVDKPDW